MSFLKIFVTINTLSPYRALLHYVEYLRPNGPVKPRSDTFFINSRGKALDKLIPYLKNLSDDANIPGVTVMKLRSLVETENFYEALGLKEVSGHMGHNIKSALKCYVAPQKVHAANAAQRITEIFQARGEVQYEATVKTLWDPVSKISPDLFWYLSMLIV